MTATDTDALTERIAEEMYYSEHPEGRHRSEWPAAVFLDTVYEYRDLAAAVLPIVAEEVRKAKAEALRSAAEMIEDMRNGAEAAEVVAYVPGEVGRQNVIDSFEAVMEEPGDWLRSLADSGEADTYREDRVNAWLAEAWDEGLEAGHRNAEAKRPYDEMWTDEEPTLIDNPYRETRRSDEHR